MARKAPTIALSPEGQDALREWVRSPRSEQQYAFRAQIVLMAAEGIQNKDIAAALGSPACTVGQVVHALCARPDSWAAGFRPNSDVWQVLRRHGIQLQRRRI